MAVNELGPILTIFSSKTAEGLFEERSRETFDAIQINVQNSVPFQRLFETWG